MKYFKKLVGDRIYLSPRSGEDAEIFTEWMNDFQVTDYTGRSAQVMTVEAERKYLESHIDDECTFVIVTIENDKMIGTISLEKIDRNHRTATLGIFIGEAEYRGHGYGTEAIQLLLEYGFHYMNLNSIRLSVLECNPRAIACYKKCGFQEMGRWRKSKFINGKYYDTLYMDILKEEFVQKKIEYIRNKNI